MQDWRRIGLQRLILDGCICRKKKANEREELGGGGGQGKERERESLNSKTFYLVGFRFS